MDVNEWAHYVVCVQMQYRVYNRVNRLHVTRDPFTARECLRKNSVKSYRGVKSFADAKERHRVKMVCVFMGVFFSLFHYA